MTGPRPEQPSLTLQNNYGSGTLIGRDNYGRIEIMDAETKAVLSKLSKEAPALGRLLSKALQDGIISPEVAFALGTVTRSINEDVASLLLTASRSINEDIAGLLHQTGRDIEETAKNLAVTANQLERTHRNYQGTSRPGETPRSPGSPAYTAIKRTGWSWNSFRWGMVASFLSILTLLVTYTLAIK
jgi:hypothetical protein